MDLALCELKFPPETPPETMNFIASEGGIESGFMLVSGTK
jgi:hypothetical protein